MQLTEQSCECCDDTFFIIDDLEDCLEYDKPSNSFYLNLDQDELTDLYHQLKQVVCK